MPSFEFFALLHTVGHRRKNVFLEGGSRVHDISIGNP
jgi:hypothetical protein